MYSLLRWWQTTSYGKKTKRILAWWSLWTLVSLFRFKTITLLGLTGAKDCLPCYVFSVCQSITHSPSLAAWSSAVIFLFSCCSPAHMSLYYRRQGSINRFVMVFRRILCPLPSFWARRLLVNYFWCQLGLSWPTVFSLQPPILPSALGFLHTKARLVVWGCQNRLRRNYSCYFCMHQPRLSEWCIGFISFCLPSFSC